MAIKKKIIQFSLLCLCVFLLSSCDWRDREVDKTKLIGLDIRHFQGTKAWEAAKAVDDGNTSKLKKLLEEDNSLVYSSDSIFGMTLLMHAAYRKNEKIVRVLLESDANPNKYSETTNNSGKNAVLIAAISSPTSVLKLLLDYGGDPNSEEKGAEEFFKRTRNDSRVSIIDASIDSYEKVRMLVNAGADINKTSRFGGDALRSSLIFDQMDIALYLLENGADYTRQYLSYDEKGKEFQSDILWTLRKRVFPIGSEKYNTKMKVVDFLRERGLDYYSSPIPENIKRKIIKEYPNEYEEILETY